jgi:hypothetical protein
VKSLCVVIAISSTIVLTTQLESYAKTDLKHNKKSSQSTSRHTPDGQPDLQGIWTNITLTPFERPVELGEKAFYTKDEFVKEEALAEQRMEGVYRPDGVGTDNDAFFDKDRRLLPTRQTSLVVDPPNGRVPLRPDMAAKSDAQAFSLDSYERIAPIERCISLGPTALFPKFVNNGYRFIQTPDAIVIYAEMMSDVRVIPLHRFTHLDSRVRGWSGDSIGHWEGDTLVVDTTNFNSRGRIASSVSQIAPRNFPQTETLHTVERFKRVDANTIQYQITFEDPQVFTQPWTVSFVFTRADAYRMFEFACHEGNYAMEAMLRGARVQEREAAKGK